MYRENVWLLLCTKVRKSQKIKLRFQIKNQLRKTCFCPSGLHLSWWMQNNNGSKLILWSITLWIRLCDIWKQLKIALPFFSSCYRFKCQKELFFPIIQDRCILHITVNSKKRRPRTSYAWLMSTLHEKVISEQWRFQNSAQHLGHSKRSWNRCHTPFDCKNFSRDWQFCQHRYYLFKKSQLTNGIPIYFKFAIVTGLVQERSPQLWY